MALVGQVHILRGGEESVPHALSLLSQWGLQSHGVIDVDVRVHSSFGIDHARELSERARTKPLSGAYRAFIAVVGAITVEAQNALLKTLEEPPASSLFFFLVPAPETLLPTFLSRAHISESPEAPVDSSPVDVRAFLKAKPEVRLDMLKVILEKGDDDKRDISSIIAFLASLERALAPHQANRDVADGIRSIYLARGYISDKGSLVKPLLEQVALLTPML